MLLPLTKESDINIIVVRAGFKQIKISLHQQLVILRIEIRLSSVSYLMISPIQVVVMVMVVMAVTDMVVTVTVTAVMDMAIMMMKKPT